MRFATAIVVVAFVGTSCTDGDRDQTRTAPPTRTDLRWSRGADMPTPRTEVAVAALGGLIYAVGGFDGDGETSDAVEIYDPDEDTWRDGVTLPQPVHHAGLAPGGDRLYLVGGYDEEGRALDAVWSLAEDEERWKREPDMPTPRGALAVAAAREGPDVRVYAFGGANAFGGRARLTPAAEVFSVSERRWLELDPLPDARDHLAAAHLGGFVDVVGGRKLSLTSNTSRVDVFNGRTDEWMDAPPMPTARGGLAAAAVEGELYVFGGEQPQGTFAAAEVLDMNRQRWSWSRAPDLPTPRHGLGAAAIGDRVYVVGGGPEPGLSVSGANEILQVRD